MKWTAPCLLGFAIWRRSLPNPSSDLVSWRKLRALCGLALLLAVVGTYGVIASIVAERRREIAIRMALGAERFNVLADVMKDGLLLAGIGVVVGLAGAFGLNRLIAALLFGV